MVGRKHRPRGAGCQRPGQAGMTLLEVMVASGVTAVAFLLALGSVMSIATTSDLTEDRTMAAATLSSVLEELRGLSYEGLLSYIPPSPGDTGDGVYVSIVCFDEAGNMQYLPVDPEYLETPLANPLPIQVTILWQDNGGRYRSMSSSALIGR